MADISKIQLPDGTIINLKDTTSGYITDEDLTISSTYVTTGTYPKRVILTVGSIIDADDTEY